ncbi:MAG: pyrroloquinoline quinone-dependent dehydrogenase [Halioglobus sp.]|nr:pyrroloquinoline quinone-dependent dehydrogenase [Halioglobus sp.]
MNAGPRRARRRPSPVAAACLVLLAGSVAAGDRPVSAGDWPVWGRDPGGSRFAPLTQITPENVEQLEVAWEYHTGDSNELRPEAVTTAFQATPVLHDNTLYFCSGLSRAFAVDAETGEQRWVFDSEPVMEDSMTGRCRGVALWHDSDPAAGDPAAGDSVASDSAASDSAAGAPATDESAAAEPCLSRVFMGTLDGRLAAIDAATGRACQDFGDGGFVNLRRGMGEIVANEVAMTSPAVVVGDLVIQGAMVRDNRGIDSPPGVIRAWDARTGELRWAFDPVPPGAPSPQAVGAPEGQRYHRGTPNAWSLLSVDPGRGLVFVPFGSPGLDYLGAHRRRHGFDLGYYANAVVALRAATGEVVWHFRAVHNDLWDYDIASQPLLIDIERDGRQVPAVVQPTKMGHLFILHRETGEPLYPVEERPVPQTNVPGEHTSPTQPFPTFPPPLHPHRLTVEDAWGLTPWDRGACRDLIANARNEGIFTPPGWRRYSLQYPGTAGGQNWGGAAFDAAHNTLIMTQTYMPMVNKIVPADEVSTDLTGDTGSRYTRDNGTPYDVYHEALMSPLGMPCIKPPWGTLMALSLDSGEKLWEVPFGTPRDMVPGLSWFPFWPNLGMPSAGGAVVTASGLVFIGASMDNYIRAFGATSGEELWRARLPAGGQATPMTYRGARSGRQFVVIAAGGHAFMRTDQGDSLLAYSLPVN